MTLKEAKSALAEIQTELEIDWFGINLICNKPYLCDGYMLCVIVCSKEQIRSIVEREVEKQEAKWRTQDEKRCAEIIES